MKKQLVCIGTVVLLLLSTLTVFSPLALGATATPRHETLIADVLTGKVGNPSDFNRWRGWTWWDKGLQQLILEPLWTVEYASGEIVNTLAEELPVYNDDFTKMTVKLRKGIYWSDGVTFTADDVIFTVETIKNNLGMSYNGELSTFVENVYKTDDYTVIFELKKPNARFHSHFLDRWGCLNIMPKHIWEKVDDPMTYEFNPPIGTGPYVLKDYDKAGYWHLYERRENWNRSATGVIYGKPKPKYVQFLYYGPVEKRVIAQTRHELDMCDLTPESLKVVLKKNPYGRAFYKEGFPLAETLHPCTTGATFNCAEFPFNIKDVRWALVLALDVADMAMTAYDGSVALAPLFVPATLPFYEWYYEPMIPWAKDFAIDVNGEPFKPFDSTTPFILAGLVKERGYPVPTEKAEINKIFGYGGWKYAPEVAEKLLTKHGFTRDSKGKWLLPDGSPWKITILTHTNPAHPMFKWAFPLAEQWKRFGIEAEAQPNEQHPSLNYEGQFGVSTTYWPINEPFGSHPDLYRSFDPYRSAYLKPIGETMVENCGRWSDPRLDQIIEEMEGIAFDDPIIIQKGIEALKIFVEEMPTIPISSYPSFISWDEYYWKNYPGGENPYTQPHYHWPNFKFMLPFLEPTGRK